MSEAPVSTENEAQDLPPGSAPQFGRGGVPTNPGSLPNVLSAAELRHGWADGSTFLLEGRFSLSDIPATGFVTVFPSPQPGFVHIDADIEYSRGGGLHYEADVRESWLEREASAAEVSPATIVMALADIARLPHQSTVRVHFRS
jgi:hypothetical protein